MHVDVGGNHKASRTIDAAGFAHGHRRGTGPRRQGQGLADINMIGGDVDEPPVSVCCQRHTDIGQRLDNLRGGHIAAASTGGIDGTAYRIVADKVMARLRPGNRLHTAVAGDGGATLTAR